MLRNKAVILAVGVLFFIVVIYNINFFLKKKSPEIYREKAVNSAAQGDRRRPVESPRTSVFPILRDSEKWKRDPFQYTGQYTGGYTERNGDVEKSGLPEKTKKTGIKLEGITVRGSKYSALVNGWVVEAGDRVDDVVITKITRYSIFVKDLSGIKEINLYNDILDKEK
jgi:hypothetical protein